MSVYLRPASLSAALGALASARYTVLAGGTDFYPARVGRAIDEAVLDITAVASLRGVHNEPGQLRIGAITTWTDILEARLPRWADALSLVAREVGGVQIQNAGTVAGNICNASPAADGVPALLALDAVVEIAGPRGVRTIALDRFIRGPRTTALAPDELVTALLLPAKDARSRSTFLKLGTRRYLVISIVMVAVTIELDPAERIVRAAIAVGAASAVARRLPLLEARLAGMTISQAAREVQAGDFDGLSPLDDVRATAAYRLAAAREIVARAITGCASRA